MGNYKRNVTYFYHYYRGNIGTTAGFLKMEVRGENVKITINIMESSNIHGENPVLCFYHETGDNLSAVKICEVKRQGGVLTLQTKTLWKKLFDTGRDLYTFDGVLVFYNNNDYYIGDFKGRDRSSYDLLFEPEDENKEGEKQDKKQEDEHDENDAGLPAVKKEKNSEAKKKEESPRYEDSFEGMLKEYPKLAMGGAEELFDCVRINPKDIGRLDISNWKLGTNSFLTHGFYTYQYLMLGKMRFDDGMKKAVLGVPGVYTNRERYLANMFGFEQFVPVKKSGTKTGQFGYWIVELNHE